jgi:mannose-6-phosphate isomerase-like protein (cupin superfamily)
MPSSPQLEQMVFAPLAGLVGSQLATDFVIAEWRAAGAPPGPPELVAPPHVHYRDDEAWYVLDGALAFQLDDRQVEAPAGSLVFVPHGVVHTYWNPRAEPARYLLIMTPKLHRLIQALHSAPERTPEAYSAIYQHHDSALVSGGAPSGAEQTPE